jgi:hypothetical protein
MEVTEIEIARIPVGNLRVPRAEFGAVWAAAERLDAEQGQRGTTDWYAGGVVVTCRWMAAAIVRPVRPAADGAVAGDQADEHRARGADRGGVPRR